MNKVTATIDNFARHPEEWPRIKAQEPEHAQWLIKQEGFASFAAFESAIEQHRATLPPEPPKPATVYAHRKEKGWENCPAGVCENCERTRPICPIGVCEECLRSGKPFKRLPFIKFPTNIWWRLADMGLFLNPEEYLEAINTGKLPPEAEAALREKP